MNFVAQAIPDVLVIEPNVVGDERGYFVETFRQDKLESVLGYKVKFVQDNESKSSELIFSSSLLLIFNLFEDCVLRINLLNNSCPNAFLRFLVSVSFVQPYSSDKSTISSPLLNLLIISSF